VSRHDDRGAIELSARVTVNADGSGSRRSQRDECGLRTRRTNPAEIKLVSKIPTGSHPSRLLLEQGQIGFCRQRSRDTISVSIVTGKVLNTISGAPAGRKRLGRRNAAVWRVRERKFCMSPWPI